MARLNDSIHSTLRTRPQTGIGAACRHCGGRIQRPSYHSGGRAHRRIFCGKACYDGYLKARRIAVAGKAPGRLELVAPADSPHRVASWAHVPARCGACGGLWRRITGGVGCLTCGRDLYVAAQLAGLEG